MNNAIRLVKREKPKATTIIKTIPQDRPSRKDCYVLELILITFGAPNVLKAIAEISSNPDVMRFTDELPKIKQNENRLEVCSHYKQFLESFVMDCGVILTLQTLLKACGNRVFLNQKHEKTKGFIGTWLATKRVIHITIEAMTGETVNTDQK
jgi:hypothetical protein